MRRDNYLREMVEYLKKNSAKGYPLDSLKWALISQGHSRTEVARAIETFHQEMAESAPVLKEKPIITHELIEEPVPEKKSFWKRLFR